MVTAGVIHDNTTFQGMDINLPEKMGIDLSEDEVRKPALDEQTHETNIASVNFFKFIFILSADCINSTHVNFIEGS